MPVSRQARTGFILVLVGLFLLLAELGLLDGPSFLVLLGGAFLAVYLLWNRHLGFLIPGAILLAIGSFATAKEWGWIPPEQDGLFLLFLAAAFLVIYVHTSRQFRGMGGAAWWPLIPAGVLAVIGLKDFYRNLVEELPYFELLDRLFIPAALILAGLVLILGGSRHSAPHSPQDDERGAM